MADGILEREHEQTEEEREHQRLMSERMRALLAGEETPAAPVAEKPVGAYEYPTFRSGHVPAYQNPAYATNEYHAPVVPTSPDAPSAARRIADYVAVTPGMQGLHRFGDEPSAKVRDYAPVAPASPEAPAATPGMLFESLLYKDGQLLDTAAPAAPEAPEMYGAKVEAPVYDPSYTPMYGPERYETPVFAPEDTGSSDDEDSKPTPRTMSHQTAAEQKQTGLLAALSMRTKLVLAAVAAVIAILLAVVCINTAIINSIDADIAEREEELARLTEQMNGIDSEIEQLTSPENIETWAIEHGMSR